MPDWGSKILDAWNSASDAGREAASKLASGATVVGQQALRVAEAAKAGAVWAGQKTAEGAEWAAEKTKEAALWAEQETKRAAQWSYEQAKLGVRHAVKAIAEPVLSGLSVAQDAWDSAKTKVSNIANQVGSAVDAIKEKFGFKKPTSIAEPCPAANPAADVDYDGTLIGKDCTPLTKKGEELTKESVAKAEGNAIASDSTCCQKKRARGEASGTIVYVNGVNTTKQQHCQTLRAIAEQTCKNVYGVYNATEGFLADAEQTSKDRRLIRQAQDGKLAKTQDGRNPAVDTLSQLIDMKSEEGEPLDLWAHSQGGAVTSLALYDPDRMGRMAGRPDPLAKVRVNSFGSAAPTWVDGPDYTHYVHVNDATPLLFGLGDDPANDAEHAGKGANVIRFSGAPDGALAEAGSGAGVDKHFIPHPTKYHGIDGPGNTYMKMQKEINGGCPE